MEEQGRTKQPESGFTTYHSYDNFRDCVVLIKKNVFSPLRAEECEFKSIMESENILSFVSQKSLR